MPKAHEASFFPAFHEPRTIIKDHRLLSLTAPTSFLVGNLTRDDREYLIHGVLYPSTSSCGWHTVSTLSVVLRWNTIGSYFTMLLESLDL